MYKIGDFSKMSKTTIKTLRYYEKEGLLIPAYIDPNTSYRYYESSQLTDLTKLISLRQAGLSINDIKEILNGNDAKVIFENRKKEIEKELNTLIGELSKINYLMEDINMKKPLHMLCGVNIGDYEFNHDTIIDVIKNMTCCDILNIQIQIFEIGNQVSVNISVISVIGGLGNFVDLKFFPHLQIVSHLGGMLTLFKITVFINQRLYHSGRFLFCSTT
mgnify:CR=1 FL=1